MRVKRGLKEETVKRIAIGCDPNAAQLKEIIKKHLEARIGVIFILSEGSWTLGTRPQDHNLSQLTEPLRSHGGYGEQTVPFLLNWGVPELENKPELWNYDIFWVALTY